MFSKTRAVAVFFFFMIIFIFCAFFVASRQLQSASDQAKTATLQAAVAINQARAATLEAATATGQIGTATAQARVAVDQAMLASAYAGTATQQRQTALTQEVVSTQQANLATVFAAVSTRQIETAAAQASVATSLAGTAMAQSKFSINPNGLFSTGLTPAPNSQFASRSVPVALIGELFYQVDTALWSVRRLDQSTASEYHLRITLIDPMGPFIKNKICLGWVKVCPGKAEVEFSTDEGTNREIFQLASGDTVSYTDGINQYRISAQNVTIHYTYWLGLPFLQDVIVELKIERVP